MDSVIDRFAFDLRFLLFLFASSFAIDLWTGCHAGQAVELFLPASSRAHGRSRLHRRRTDRILVYGFAAVHLPVQDGHDGRQLAAVHHQALYDEDEAEPHGRDGQVQRTLRQVEQ